MRKSSSDEVLEKMIALLLLYVDELFEFKDEEGAQFQYGERTAYTECLELLQHWEHAEKNGLDFDVEKRYPL